MNSRERTTAIFAHQPVDNVVFRMDSGYESEEISEVVEGTGYQCVVKAKEYSKQA